LCYISGVPKLPVALSLLLALSIGCSASAPASDEATNEEALGGGPPQILVPVAGAEKAIAAACAKELDATYCSNASLATASARCTAKLGADVLAACGGECLAAYSPSRASCRAGATYPTPAACDTPVADDCAFYRACLEASTPCGDGGYAVDFGERLCYAFVEDRASFTPRGQAWLRRIRTCLQTSIAPALHEGLACSALEDAAYAAHAPCYTQRGDSICHLPARDVIEIARVLGTTLLSSRGLAQIEEVATACLLDGIGLAAPITPPSAQEAASAPASRAFFEGLSRAAADARTLRAFLDDASR
jgi:hypothetical protein